MLLGRQHIKDGFLKFTASKNQARKPVVINVPVIEPLQRALATVPAGDLSFLVTRSGKPFSKVGFSNKFKRWCVQAGLPHCSAHGLRKASATISAESGVAKKSELSALYGWSDPDMAAHYTRSANRRVLAAAGSAKSVAAMGNASSDILRTKVSHFQRRFQKVGQITPKNKGSSMRKNDGGGGRSSGEPVSTQITLGRAKRSG